MGGLHFQETSILAEGLREGYTSKIHSIYARGLMGRLQFQESSIFTGRYMGGLHFQESWKITLQKSFYCSIMLIGEDGERREGGGSLRMGGRETKENKRKIRFFQAYTKPPIK